MQNLIKYNKNETANKVWLTLQCRTAYPSLTPPPPPVVLVLNGGSSSLPGFISGR